MKLILPFLLLLSALFANDMTHKFASNQECMACHPTIYEEFTASMHANSTPQKDPIHNAVWGKLCKLSYAKS